ncbi:MAG: hypothetical protein AAFQ57_07075, partial [Cyanobacteria bacterium J06626_14]
MNLKPTIAGLDLPNADQSSKLYRILASVMKQHLERSPVAPRCQLSNRHPYSSPARPSNRLHSPFSSSPQSTARRFTDSKGISLPGSQQDLLLDCSSDSAEPDIPLCDAYWNASYFGLDRVRLFRDATAEEQRQILSLTNLNVMQESYCIEKAGMGYMSRMVLLAETVQERMIYTLFAAD